MENKKVLKGAVDTYSKIGFGANAYVYQAEYLEGLCACKEFIDPKYVSIINDKMLEIGDFYKDYSDKFIFPFKFVYRTRNDENFYAYLMDYYYNYNGLDSIELSKKEKLELIKRARDLVEKLHKDYKILHCDLNSWNFLYNSEKDNLLLSDFDTAVRFNKECDLSPRLHSDICLDYIENNGLDEGVDIFLFNIFTYSLLNNIDPYSVIFNINNNKYGEIKSQKAREILNSYKDLKNEKVLKKEYIIDLL